MASPPSSGTQLGRYEVLQSLTSGAMAELLLARTTGMQSFERHVVIKRIRPELAQDERFVKMFLEEARLAASLHHQNIVQVHDVGEQDGAYFFAMEYVHGEDLRRVITHVRERGEQIPIAIVIAIVCAAAAGLHHAHEKVGSNLEPLNIVHRDVSPGNILVGYDGSVKLGDFGLAKAALRNVKTRAGTLKGKSAYMSPEQCLGKDIDRRSDVFALGIVLYELATARRLFKAENDFLSMSAIVVGEVPPPSTHRPDLPPELDAITLRALAKAPETRYPTTEAMRASLEQLAVALGLRTSPKALADYMRDTFGERLEPWRSDAIRTTRPRYDESKHFGIVPPPATPEKLVDGRNLDSSPIAFAQSLVEMTKTEPHGPEFVSEDATVASPPPEFAIEDPSRGSTTQTAPLRVGADDTTTATSEIVPPATTAEGDGETSTARVLSDSQVDAADEIDDDAPTLVPRSAASLRAILGPRPVVFSTARPGHPTANAPPGVPTMPGPPAQPPNAPPPMMQHAPPIMQNGPPPMMQHAPPLMTSELADPHTPSWLTVLKENRSLVIAGVAAFALVVTLIILLATRHT